MSDKIEAIVAFLLGVCEKRETQLSKDYDVEEDRIREYITGLCNSPDSFVKLDGQSLLILFCVPHDFTYKKVCHSLHYIGLDGRAGKILREGEAWAKEKGAEFIVMTTGYTHDDRILSLFKRKGYLQDGYTLHKKLKE